VVAVVLAREQQARLAAALRARAVVRFVGRWREVLPALAAGRAAAVILEPRDADGAPAAPTVAQLRRAFPYTPVLVLCPLTPAAAPDILAAAKAGASGLIVRDAGDAGAALAAALDAASGECAARLALDELGALVPSDVRPILEFCLTHAERRLTVDDVANALGMHRKTLAARLARAGMPTPLALIGWCRLLAAARAMEEGGRTLEQVALRLEFPGAAALRNMLARYTRLTPREVRAPGGLRAVVAAFRQALTVARPGLGTAPGVSPAQGTIGVAGA
jgi:AraC-like DNA-binding protein